VESPDARKERHIKNRARSFASIEAKTSPDADSDGPTFPRRHLLGIEQLSRDDVLFLLDETEP
jgi:hypothetical protein